jgi:hypothetical protein
MIVVTILVYVACRYHIRDIRVIVAVPTTFLSGAGVKLIFGVDVTLR